MVDDWPSEKMLESLALVAPGTRLREGVDRVLSSKTGGLFVLGGEGSIERMCSGGFVIDAQLTPQRVSELSKMDGAVLLDDQATRILQANVHLSPNADFVTNETGIRHRIAERVAQQCRNTVVSVSQKMDLISVYREDEKYILQPVTRVLSRANQAVATLERHRERFNKVSVSLSALEVEDLVTTRDVLLVLQHGEMVRRIAREANVLLMELGIEGRLLRLQVAELSFDLVTEIERDLRDYLPDATLDLDAVNVATGKAMRVLGSLPTASLRDLYTLTEVLGVSPSGMDAPTAPRGYRFLSKIPRLPGRVVSDIVWHFDGLQKILNAMVHELGCIESIGEEQSVEIKEKIVRLADSLILDRYS